MTSFSLPSSLHLRHEWQRLLSASDDPFAIYQFSEWYDYMRESQGGLRPGHSLAVRRDADKKLIGIVPLYLTEQRRAVSL